MTMIRVTNLSTLQRVEYHGISPREAVANAYAQYTDGNWNTWSYESYNAMVEEGRHSFICGDWCALKASNTRSNKS